MYINHIVYTQVYKFHKRTKASEENFDLTVPGCCAYTCGLYLCIIICVCEGLLTACARQTEGLRQREKEHAMCAAAHLFDSPITHRTTINRFYRRNRAVLDHVSGPATGQSKTKSHPVYNLRVYGINTTYNMHQMRVFMYLYLFEIYGHKAGLRANYTYILEYTQRLFTLVNRYLFIDAINLFDSHYIQQIYAYNRGLYKIIIIIIIRGKNLESTSRWSLVVHRISHYLYLIHHIK